MLWLVYRCTISRSLACWTAVTWLVAMLRHGACLVMATGGGYAGMGPGAVHQASVCVLPHGLTPASYHDKTHMNSVCMNSWAKAQGRKYW